MDTPVGVHGEALEAAPDAMWRDSMSVADPMGGVCSSERSDAAATGDPHTAEALAEAW